MTLAPGLRAQSLLVVEMDDTAKSVGSGDVPVLATPRLLALAEATTVRAVERHLAPGQTSVGTRVELEHVAASPLGTRVRVGVELTRVDGRRLTFAFEAHDEHAVVGKGTIERVVVDRVRFLAASERR
ncbi:thioesterase [Nonomuraea sp. KC401]|uniref:thioesterase family protein n=1 Tax=unclassified Nonomuraea TaxID=2593643 RepID=UPI0010FD7955|nr:MULTISPECIES: hotdog domain-containing protein [unclassified Nonomuraea]NBE98497.1 thioesterase [Nonomuraea sp. K271]TLF83248.1 thioesterase [Nonomuraea sp. KC401]